METREERTVQGTRSLKYIEQAYVIYRGAKKEPYTLFFKIMAGGNEQLDLQLRSFGITNLAAFKNAQVKEEIIANRTRLNDRNDVRPMALICFARHDWMVGMDVRWQEELCELIRSGYRVVYFEASGKKDFFSMLSQFKGTRAISLFIVGGTGAPHHIAFSDKIERGGGYDVRVSDEKALRRRRFHSCMKKNSVIILQSCSTGKPGYRHTMANMMSRVFPMSRVFAPTDTINTLEFIWGRRARVAGVLFNRSTVRMLRGRIARVLKALPLWVFMEGPVEGFRREHLGEKELLSALYREYGEGGAHGPQKK